MLWNFQRVNITVQIAGRKQFDFQQTTHKFLHAYHCVNVLNTIHSGRDAKYGDYPVTVL